MTQIEVKKLERTCEDTVKIVDDIHNCEVTLRTIKYLNTKSQKGKHPFGSKQWDDFMTGKIKTIKPTYQFSVIIKKHPTRKFDLTFG